MAGDDMNEVITRGILRQELGKLRHELGELRQEFKRDLGELREELRQEIKQELRPYATKVDLEIWAGAIVSQIREELQSALGVILGQLERNQRLALEPTISLPERVATLEGADLPGRVERLEAKVFRPRRTSRRGRS